MVFGVFQNLLIKINKKDIIINTMVIIQGKLEIHVYPGLYTYHIALRRIVFDIGIS